MITMAELERTYIIPLRREWLRVPKYRRAKRAVHAVQNFLKRHMKAKDLENVKLGRFLNEAIWARGINNPPHKIKVNVNKDDKGLVFAELYGKEMPKKTEEKKGLGGKIVEKVTGKKEEKKTEKKTEAPKQELSGETEIKQELKKLEEKTKTAKPSDDKTKAEHKKAEETLQRLKKESVAKK